MPTLNGIQQRIEAMVEHVPPLSPTATKLLTLKDDIDASPAELLRTIRLDPILTARVLRLVNSPHFGLEEPTTSVNRALVILGLNTIKNLAVSSAAAGLMFADDAQDPRSQQLWTHSLWVGVAARAIARAQQHNRQEQEKAFVAGLLHDIGEICLLKAVPDEFEALLQRMSHGMDRLRLEVETFGLDHQSIGSLIARRWEFPEAIAAAIEHHHDPLLTGPHALLSCTVHVANEMAYAFNHAHKRGMPPHISGAALDLLQLDESVVIEALSDVSKEVEAAQMFLES